MCMATYIPGNIEIPYEGLKNGAETNRDGHGWAVASRHGIEVGKSMNFEKALAGLIEARQLHGKDSLALFHSRFATHGTVDEFNVHPFYVDENTVVAHNGIMPANFHPAKGDKRSDTQVFTDEFIDLFINPETGVPSRRKGKELGKIIGGGNKLVILSVASGEPRVRLINAYQGEQADGVWYSNGGYKPFYSYNRTWNYGSCAAGVLGGRGAYSWDPWDEDFTDRKWTEHDGWVELNRRSGYYDAACDVCEALGFVNIDTDWCEMCNTCLVCYNDCKNCSCYWADGQSVASAYHFDENGNPIEIDWIEGEADEETSKELVLYGGNGESWDY